MRQVLCVICSQLLTRNTAQKIIKDSQLHLNLPCRCSIGPGSLASLQDTTMVGQRAVTVEDGTGSAVAASVLSRLRLPVTLCVVSEPAVAPDLL